MLLALAGDTMLGRKVAERIRAGGVTTLFAPEVVEVTAAADLFVLNLECCVSEGGAPWPDPAKPFFFRAPPAATEALRLLGVDCVTLANNHALDFGYQALLDTLHHLQEAGIRVVGAGADLATARSPVVLTHQSESLGIVAFTDHPAEFAAAPDRPGVAYADLAAGRLPEWVTTTIADLAERPLLVTPHWGPNMVREPVRRVRSAAEALLAAGVELIAGHSAHVFHGAAGPVLFDLGDFIDDYAVDRRLRNDLGLLWLVEVQGDRVRTVEAVPLALDYCHTRLADRDEAAWISARLSKACAAFGTGVRPVGDRLRLEPGGDRPAPVS